MVVLAVCLLDHLSKFVDLACYMNFYRFLWNFTEVINMMSSCLWHYILLHDYSKCPKISNTLFYKFSAYFILFFFNAAVSLITSESNGKQWRPFSDCSFRSSYQVNNFLISLQNICFGYSGEVPYWGASNE